MLDATFGDYQSTSLEDNIKNTLSIYKNTLADIVSDSLCKERN